MSKVSKAARRASIGVVLASLAGLSPSEAQVPQDVRTDFVQWAQQSLHQVSDANLDAPAPDLQPMREMIGTAKIVGLSEGQHAAAEPLVFRNRLFKYLVENLGFGAVAIESGIVESRLLNDYVTQGKGELDTVLKQGFSAGFDTFRQNVELIGWLRNYNARLPPVRRECRSTASMYPAVPATWMQLAGPKRPSSTRYPTAAAFDVVYFVSPVTSACL